MYLRRILSHAMYRLEEINFRDESTYQKLSTGGNSDRHTQCGIDQCVNFHFNSLPHKKTLDWSKPKAFAADKINVTEKSKFALGRVENILGKGENAVNQQFLLFSQCFRNASISGAPKVGIVW